MKKAYIILAHKNLDQLTRLVKRLDDNLSSFFIHIDKKVSREEMFRFLECSANLHMVEQINTEWGEFSLVEATLNGLKAVKETGVDFGMISLLSGQDYPLKSNKFFIDFCNTTSKLVLMEHYPLPNYTKWINGGGMYRINKYFLGLKAYQRYLAKALNFFALLFPFLRRKMPGNLVPYAGSQWWTIDMYALDYILDYVHKNPAYTSYYKYTFAPDEVFFQTILLNAKDQKLLDSIQNNNKRHMLWLNPDMSHPEILTLKDIDGILASDAFFARKFDMHHDAGVLDCIDNECLLHTVDYSNASVKARRAG